MWARWRGWRGRLVVIAASVPTALVPAVQAAAAPAAIHIDEHLRGETAQTVDVVEAHGLSAETVTLLERQAVIDEIAAKIDEAAKVDLADGSGLSGLVVAAERNELEVYWHGKMPEAVERHIAQARRDGIVVSVKSAPFTRDELLAEIERMTARPLFEGERVGRRTLVAAPASDGTGIDVELGGLPGPMTAEGARQLVPALDSDYPLSITLSTGVLPAYRWIDFPAYWGGSYIVTAGHTCSSAFGVTGINGAATYMLTAAHCGRGGSQWRTGAVALGDGTVVVNTLGEIIPGRDLDRDGAAILTRDGSGSHVYVGASINPDMGDLGSNTGVRVGGAANSFEGDLVCTGGAPSGTICGIRVAATGVTVVYDPPMNDVGRVTGMVNAQTVNEAVAGQGDSGGPVYSINPSSNSITALGIISGISLGPNDQDVRPCRGWAPANRICSRSMFYGPVLDIMRTIGVRINT